MNDSVGELHGIDRHISRGTAAVVEGLNADFVEHLIDVTGMVALHQSEAVIQFCLESLSLEIL